jgi:hypothetical protein
MENILVRVEKAVLQRPQKYMVVFGKVGVAIGKVDVSLIVSNYASGRL